MRDITDLIGQKPPKKQLTDAEVMDLLRKADAKMINTFTPLHRQPTEGIGHRRWI